MPIYEYVCPECKNKFEKMRPFSQSGDPADCPECKTASKRVLSKFACFSKGEGGVSNPVGGSGCAGCGSGSCSTCGS